MSREAIESFVDEIRDEVPKIRRALAIIHACPEDRDSLHEVHRLVHSIKGTALLVQVPVLSQIALKQELLIEQIMEGRLSMDHLLRDSLERLTDIYETYASWLLVGSVPEQKLLDDANALFERHAPSEVQISRSTTTTVAEREPMPLVEVATAVNDRELLVCDEGLPSPTTAGSDADEADPSGCDQGQIGDRFGASLAVSGTRQDDLGTDSVPLDDVIEAGCESGSEIAYSDVEQSATEVQAAIDDNVIFHESSIEHLQEMAHKLDLFRRDLTRWDLLADVRRRIHSLKGAASTCGFTDFAHLAHHTEDLLQRVLDWTVPPTESSVDCLQACVDALEQQLDGKLDLSIQQLLHERLDEICGGRPRPLLANAADESRDNGDEVSSQIEFEPSEFAEEETTHGIHNGALECPSETDGGSVHIIAERVEATQEKSLSASGLADPIASDAPSENSISSVDAVTATLTPTDPESIQLDDHDKVSGEMLEVFTEEADDHLRQIYAAFAGLEKQPGKMSLIQDVRRSAHTIKGAAGSVGLWQVSKLSHRMEDLLEELFESQRSLTPSTFALLYDTTDTLQDLVHGNFAPAEMQVAIAQLYDGYDIALNPQTVTTFSTSNVASIVNVTDIALESLVEEVPVSEQVQEADIQNSEAHAEPFQLIDIDYEAPLHEPLPPDTNLSLCEESSVVTESAADCADPTLQSPAVELSNLALPVAEQATLSRPEIVEQASVAPINESLVKSVLPGLAVWSRLSPPTNNVAQPVGKTDEKKPNETLRVPVERIDSLVREVGELIINRSAFEQRMSDFTHCVEEIQRAVERLRGTSNTLDTRYGVGALGGRRRLRGDGASLLRGGTRLSNSGSGALRQGQEHEEFDALEMDRYSEFHLLSRSLAETTTDIGTVGQELQNLIGEFDQLLNRQGRLSRGTQDRLMQIRMVPLAVLTTRLHRTVRVVSGQLNKQVDFLIQGGETEFDKMTLEELADPLMHILRNAVDHGIESADARRAAGKPERATITVQALYQGTQAILRVTDDGSGLDLNAIRETAIRNGLVTSEAAENFSDEELSAFIFLPGFSTARELSEVSGRGVGMDIVRDRVLKLKGTVSVESRPGHGTTITIRLPMTLAVTRALLIHSSNETFAIPMQAVVQILRIERDKIEYVDGEPIIRLKETTMPMVYLGERLRLRLPQDKTLQALPVLIVASGDERAAIAVEKISHGRDIVVKTLGSHLRRVQGLIGATLLGDGSVVPILDAASLVGHAGTVTRATQRGMEIPTNLTTEIKGFNSVASTPVRREQPVIMVIDDSVSVRRVMLNLLKKTGWTVLDAKDGVDALEKLHLATEQPNLFLLDIEMPRMDGYELLSSLRASDEHRETPVIMVTSRAGEKHRKKALQLGASDYLVKPYQDDQLLTVIRKLLEGEAVTV